ncbi:MAG: amino acid adenylation domain-containing protein, partial [Gammaproteobacteria bacterium]|nr:amino acid adenylation domain-containing protein [Gammaproteobacteria bacterium]
KRVPEHLIPQSWVFLAELPLGVGGKLDREALPAPGAARPRLAGPRVAPRSAAEHAVSGLWTEVLGLESLGVEDDFFELGGDSIAAVQLITRLQRWLNAGVPLAALFEAPSIAGLVRYMEEHFAGPLAVALGRVRAVAAPAPVPATQTVAGRTPLTFSQQSLWFLHTLYPGDTSASEQFALRISGPLDAGRLEQAWRRLLARHPILTATFAEELGTCLISPRDMRHEKTRHGEMRHVPIAAESELIPIAEAALREHFDLARGPLVRPVLCRHSAESHVLLVTAHHIVADGLSVPVLQADLARLYDNSAAAGLPAPLSYAALAALPAWQTGSAAPAALDWWRQRLANLPPPALEALVRPPRGERVSRRVPFTLEAELADGLRQLARTANATPYMTLLAAFRVLLARLTGQPDICIGTPMTLRDTPELREVVGCLVNPVVLRVPVNLQQSFRGQLQVERAATLETFHYRTVPFSTVVAAVAPVRELGVHPLFQILFSWEPALPAQQGNRDLEFEILSVPAARASYYDLECALRDAGEGAGLSGYFAWSSAALEDWVAEQLPQRLRTLLTELLARPDEPLERLALLDRVERQRVLVDWNDSAFPVPLERTLHEWFLAQAARTPNAVALRGEQRDWSYGELAARSAALAAKLATELRDQGVSGRHVGIAIGRTPELVLAVLAVLRAGGTVVPLDPGLPPARLEFMARDAQLALTLVLVDGEVVAAPPGATGSSPSSLRRSSKEDPVAPGGAPAPAFLLYTSGSSGQPKGAFTTHESAVNRCHWLWRTFGFGAGEVFALRTTPNFIDAWWEIFGALGHGVPLQIVPDDLATDPRRLPAFLARTGVTQLVLVPSLLRALLDELAATATPLPALRFCIVSGEPLPPALVTACRRLLPGMTLLNTYGTSEIWDATACDTRELVADAARVPIGRPVGNARVYILDAAGEPLPPGFPGELQVAGLGVGAGYWQRPALTAEKFRRLAVPGMREERVYRTGDRARFLPDGQVELLERLDAQFKLRGQRIEPAEIEQTLAAHPQVAAAVVGIAGDGTGAVLVAGVVKSGAGPLAVEALRAHLQAQLPAWMVPAEWRELPALPLTPSGKLDRLRFVAAGDGTPLLRNLGPTGLAPCTALEAQLAGLWSEVLGGPLPSVHDNFFDLGGHSLLAARLLTRIRSTCGVDLELRALFVAPTIAALAEEIAARRPVLVDEPPPAEDPSRPATVSFGQERLWFLEQLDPGSPAYNVAWTIRCLGPLALPALRVALDALVARHPALRTRFLNVAGRPQPVTDPAGPLPLAVLTVGPADELASTLATLSRRPFDLEQGPLLRVTLLQTGPQDHHLLLVAPHIVTDATSNHSLFAELAVAWAAALEGVAPDWPPLPLTYAEFARRQRAQSGAPRLQRALDWWRQRLANAPTALELPTDRPRPAEQRFAGAWVQRSVPAALPGNVASALSAFARHAECTPYMVLLAAFKALLHRYSGAVDLLVGTPVEGRLTADVEPIVGLFINTLVMRTDLSGDPSFSELLARVRNTALDAQAHQEVPFEQLVEVLAPERSLRRSPVFQVLFNLVQVPERTRRVGPLELKVDRLIDQGVSSFDLTLTAAVERDGLALTFEYATDLFAAETIEQLADSYLTLLGSALGDPAQALSRLPLLGASDQQAVLALGRGAPASTVGALVHERVAARARQSPEAPAVILDGESRSYGALDAAANRLAHYLIARGAGRGARVGICLPRSTDYLVAVLAVLKTGAAYVPLDPAYPPERLAGMAADATLCGLIVNAVTEASLTPTAWRADLDADRAAIARCSATDPALALGSDDPAYVLFTSGSTGRPKGVVVSHGNLTHALNGWQSAYELQPGEAHLQMASAAFDVFTGDWVRALCTGGALVVCPRDVVLDPPALLALLRDAHIRVAEFVPAVLRLLLEHCAAAGENLPPLRLLIVGSDHWYGSDLEALRLLTTTGTRLVNSYGTAEATIDSTWFEARTAAVDGSVPIGKPFPGVSIYVLDAHGGLAPRGVPGELCIGGGGVATGYWNAPLRTAEKFATDPFNGTAGARLYRTGDRARWNRSGQLELLGRSDAQFKLRGFRIEPAEIEACLTALPAVAAAAVGLQNTAGGESQLVAWLVARGEPATRDELRQALGRRLPEQLVPAVFLWLPGLPLTPNGKVDRAALASAAVGAPLGAIPQAIAAKAAPTGAVEALICRLYADLLGVAVIGADEDFFRAGGHSLLATRLVARLREALQREVPLRTVFEAPTPRGLAARLGGPGAPLQLGPRARPRKAGEPLPLSPMQQRLWFLERLQPGTGAYHLHWLLRLRGPLDRQALQAALDALVARHETLRTAFVEKAGVPAQAIASSSSVTVGAPLGANSTEIRTLIAQPFDLSVAPLVRVTVLATGPDDHQLLVVMHHLIADGWSFSVLSRELAVLYNAARRGGVASLPALPLQYADYALWQQQAVVNGRWSEQLEFWRRALAGAPPLLALPVREGGAVVVSNRGAWIDRVVPPETVAALDALAIAQGCTLFMVLLAGFKVVLARLAAVDDVLVGTPVAGRTHQALEGLIGFFVNTLVLRTELKGAATFREVLGRVRQMTLQAFENADVPFEKLVEVLKPRRSLAHSPLVQVLFALHNQPQQPLELDGLEVQVETVQSETVKFDLNLHAAMEEGCLRLALAWRTDLYDAAQVNGLLEQYVALLEEVAAAPDLTLDALPAGAPEGAACAATTALPVRGIAAKAAPTGEIEAALAGIFRELLGVTVGVTDDFFELGGHSLLATRLVAAIAERLGTELPLISVFEAPTVRGLAARVGGPSLRPLPPIPRLARHPDPGEAQ